LAVYAYISAVSQFSESTFDTYLVLSIFCCKQKVNRPAFLSALNIPLKHSYCFVSSCTLTPRFLKIRDIRYNIIYSCHTSIIQKSPVFTMKFIWIFHILNCLSTACKFIIAIIWFCISSTISILILLIFFLSISKSISGNNLSQKLFVLLHFCL
jgi:hypothetical protein